MQSHLEGYNPCAVEEKGNCMAGGRKFLKRGNVPIGGSLSLN